MSPFISSRSCANARRMFSSCLHYQACFQGMNKTISNSINYPYFGIATGMKFFLPFIKNDYGSVLLLCKKEWFIFNFEMVSVPPRLWFFKGFLCFAVSATPRDLTYLSWRLKILRLNIFSIFVVLSSVFPYEKELLIICHGFMSSLGYLTE